MRNIAGIGTKPNLGSTGLDFHRLISNLREELGRIVAECFFKGLPEVAGRLRRWRNAHGRRSVHRKLLLPLALKREGEATDSAQLNHKIVWRLAD